MTASIAKRIAATVCFVSCLTLLIPTSLTAQVPATLSTTKPDNGSIIGRCGCDSCNRMPAHNPAFNNPGANDPNGFILSTRWNATSLSGGGLAQGDATILTWSIVPDGTDTNADTGFVPSNLIAEFDSMFNESNAGTPDLTNRNWFAQIQQGLNRWGEISGVEYVYEPNDDGQDNFSAGGVLGVRGDVRIGGFNIDGPGSVLAFNAFPDNGDMSLDTTDGFFSNPNNNFVAMRNIISHEAGHGLGFSHVEPTGDPPFLMNPFINTSFDGPQLDDVLAAHRGYGDVNEKSNDFAGNDTIANATDMGLLPGDSTVTFGVDGSSGTAVGGNDVDFLSVDDNSDDDFYRFSMSNPGLVSVTVTPVGVSYMNGPQNGTASLFEPSQNSDLAVAVFDASGTLVESANSTSNGQAESITSLLLPAGDLFVQVSGSSNAVQLYELEMTTEIPSIALALASDIPQFVSPDGGTTISIEVSSLGSTPDPSTATLFINRGAGFESFPLVENSSTMYSAVLPTSTCGEEVQFYFSIDSVSGATATLPFNAPTSTFAAISALGIENLFVDDFESDLSWTVSGDATDGQWERAIPNNGDRGDPAADPQDTGLGFCFVTDNGNTAGDDNTDVDGGSTILTSPIMDASVVAGDIPIISYFRWYDNSFGASPMADIFEVEISNDGGATWVELETVGPAGPEVSGGWILQQFRIDEFVAPSDQIRLRFIASDDGDGSVVEAGVDGVSLDFLSCSPDFVCGDVNLDGTVNLLDVGPFIDLLNTGEFQLEADINGDSAVNLLDVGPFVDKLSGP